MIGMQSPHAINRNRLSGASRPSISAEKVARSFPDLQPVYLKDFLSLPAVSARAHASQSSHSLSLHFGNLDASSHQSEGISSVSKRIKRFISQGDIVAHIICLVETAINDPTRTPRKKSVNLMRFIIIIVFSYFVLDEQLIAQLTYSLAIHLFMMIKLLFSGQCHGGTRSVIFSK